MIAPALTISAPPIMTANAAATGPLLDLIDIGKTYPGVVALSGVNLSVAPGEIIGLVGENGAGKSTLMKILGGVVAPSEGTIRIDGAERAAMSVADATKAGIAFVHQELNLFDNCLLYTSPSPRDGLLSRMPSSA